MPQVFISHSTEDRAFVEKELLPLLRKHGIGTWYSQTDIRTAEQWEKGIRSALEKCDWFLVVMSPRSAASRWVEREVHWAMEERHGRFIPVLIDASDFRDWHVGFRELQYVDFFQNKKAARKRLLAGCGGDRTKRKANILHPSKSPFSPPDET